MNKTPLEEALFWGTCQLRPLVGERARHEARLLLGYVLEREPQTLGFTDNISLTQKDLTRFQDLIARRLTHEPISRIVGLREFWSLDFVISPHTLDPRPDSEILVEAVLARLKKLPSAPGRFVDFGTGSGCLLVALLSENAPLTGVGVDKSLEALLVARENARLNGVDARASFVCSSWGTALRGPFDFIVSNPPYIPAGEIETLDPTVKNFDPHLALTPGATGLEAYATLARDCHALLAPQGFCALEIGAGQEKDTAALFEAQGFTLASTHADLQGHIRCLMFVQDRRVF